jgi:hypothetical protein
MSRVRSSSSWPYAISRRDVLQASALGMAGFTVGQQALASPEPTTVDLPQFGRAKACILLFLFGAPPQHETFDPKPDAAAEIQGQLKAIPTSLPGVPFCEGLPLTAQVADRLTVVRSMTHPFPLHCVAYALSGLPNYTVDLETKPRDPTHWPYFGSIADHLWARQGVPDGDLPRHVGLPWVFNSQVDDAGLLAGPYASFLGQRHDPLWAKFEGKPLRVAPKCRHEQTKEYVDPYASVEADCRFEIDGAGRFGENVDDERFLLRRELLGRFPLRPVSDRAARATAGLPLNTPPRSTSDAYSLQQQRALSLLTSTSLRSALDVSREPAAVREDYGYTLFGQSCLAARRLVEAGTKFVTVFWDAYGTYFSGGWDTHQNHYPRLTQYLLPGFDRAYAALIRDLDQSGLLDDTLVICMGEHGRTPQIDSKPAGAARHHWSQVYSATLAGGGVPRGAVIGRSDAIGGQVLDTPISPKDIHATTFHLLGLDPHALMYDRQRRPYPVSGAGEVRAELLA